MSPVNFPDVLPVFLKALDDPEYARPEFFIKEQVKSGWSKGGYLNALLEACSPLHKLMDQEQQVLQE